MTATQPTAAVLLIGDEILSGRTKDKNLGFLADYLTALGIDLVATHRPAPSRSGTTADRTGIPGRRAASGGVGKPTFLGMKSR